MLKKFDFEQAQTVLDASASVIAAWVFGSAQSGEVHPGGDIDIGVLFESPPSVDEQLDLLAGLQATLNHEEIDLVVLNGANPILRFEAISGKALFCRCRDAGRRAEFASLTAREYEDSMALWQRGLMHKG